MEHFLVTGNYFGHRQAVNVFSVMGHKIIAVRYKIIHKVSSSEYIPHIYLAREFRVLCLSWQCLRGTKKVGQQYQEVGFVVTKVSHDYL